MHGFLQKSCWVSLAVVGFYRSPVQLVADAMFAAQGVDSKFTLLIYIRAVHSTFAWMLVHSVHIAGIALLLRNFEFFHRITSMLMPLVTQHFLLLSLTVIPCFITRSTQRWRVEGSGWWTCLWDRHGQTREAGIWRYIHHLCGRQGSSQYYYKMLCSHCRGTKLGKI